MSITSWIAKKLLQKKMEGIMGKIMSLLDGWKTYITAALGIIMVVVGHFWGPLSLGGIEIPYVEAGAMWQVIWAALTGIFLRQGVAKSGPKPV
jgi:hypothetical protein